MSALIGGIDDAGRGSIIGPLVIAGVVVRADERSKLTALGVRDSKLLTPGARADLAPQIRRLAVRCHLVRLPPALVDDAVLRERQYRGLNHLEAIAMARVAAKLGVRSVYVDASDTSPRRFASMIRSVLRRPRHIIAHHHADTLFPVVSAASILAKVERDRAVARLRQRFGDFGSGYPSDPATRRFLRLWWMQELSYPPFARASWKTWEALRTQDLLDFVARNNRVASAA